MANLSDAIDNHLLDGARLPDLVDAIDPIVICQGSCFARNIASAMAATGIATAHLDISEDVNTLYANAELFSCLAREPSDPLVQELIRNLITETTLKEYGRLLRQASLLVLTVGVAPCWFVAGSDQVVLGPNRDNLAAFEMRTMSPGWQARLLRKIIRTVRSMNQTIPIVLTLSPVPLAATNEMNSAVVADCLSKATLRVTIQEVLGDHDPLTFYWPSFEIVRWLAPYFVVAFDRNYPRKLDDHLVATIVQKFIARANLTRPQNARSPLRFEDNLVLTKNF